MTGSLDAREAPLRCQGARRGGEVEGGLAPERPTCREQGPLTLSLSKGGRS